MIGWGGGGVRGEAAGLDFGGVVMRIIIYSHIVIVQVLTLY